MTPIQSVALASSAPPPSLVPGDLEGLLSLAAILALSAFLSTLRAALHHSHTGRILAAIPDEERRRRFERRLARAEELAASAGILKITADLVFVALLIGLTARDGPLQWTHLLLALGMAAPSLLLFTEALPSALARARGDALLLRVLPAFYAVQFPIGLLVLALEAVRRAILRLLRLRDTPASARQIVAGLREVIEVSSISGDLDATEREIIENVMEFRDVDVAAVMTPRTEIHAVEVGDGIEAAMRVFASSGHSRIPVYRESIDNIIGTITALEVTKALVEGSPPERPLLELLRPAYLVPETKRVSELLTEFRARKQKIAIVLDEYGGTAGLVTLGDVVAEIVGEIQDEHELPEESMREVDDGVFEVPAALHVSDVNEALGLDLPEEEDYETLGGFVLAELGHFPREGETFMRGEVEFSIVEASDRRVLRVAVRRSA